MLTCMLKEFEEKTIYDAYPDNKLRTSILDGKFVFSLTWAIGGSADTNSRKKM